jgi:hypothetical protein
VNEVEMVRKKSSLAFGTLARSGSFTDNKADIKSDKRKIIFWDVV